VGEVGKNISMTVQERRVMYHLIKSQEYTLPTGTSAVCKKKHEIQSKASTSIAHIVDQFFCDLVTEA
jgi:hypothetical protein